ncbi:phosphodiester glycosidase family protein [Enterococcus sp. RIT-PI-f]|uniref:phosphodiester glycosidase family protein n=1 Tax=Enterococcus sp. RIT-PI-f TaxID=1690244 RepID=UPI00128DFE6D|nr:phosphodiester glycosidase family protein [Enterococcus sp. RIT-PI-f]
MMNWLKKPYRWAWLFSLLLTASSCWILLKAFVLPDRQVAVATVTDSTAASTDNSTEETTASSESVVATDTSYTSDGLTITLTEKRVDETTVYIADIQTVDSSHLQTALAENTYGRNIKETTSAMAAENEAVLAINGDYYGFRSTGFVLRNGTLYRDTANGDTQALVIDQDGNFSIVDESTTSAESLTNAQQILSFGPALIEDGQIAVSTSAEVSQSMTSNPRTAIGQIGENHYVIIVSEGRTSDSEGLTLYQLAEQFEELGATTAYNLDGGGSSTLYFNGKVVNQTVGGSDNSEERAVSDILYFK